MTEIQSYLKNELAGRRARLEAALASQGGDSALAGLLHEVDAALARIESGSYGLCESCHDSIEMERLIADPLERFCLDHLSAGAQRSLELDLQLAASIQAGLLPAALQQTDRWVVDYRYDAAGPVSGDYCDVIRGQEDDFFFLVGDVSGKGVAASMLMSHLHAMFRTLVSVRLPLAQMMERAGRLFCEVTLPTHYATLLCGRALPSGAVEICNAGHPPPLLVRRDRVEPLGAGGLPLGMFCSGSYTPSTLELAGGDTLVLYTDGYTEAESRTGEAFGIQRLQECVLENAAEGPAALVEACRRRLLGFTAGASIADDLTILAVRRA